MGYFSLNNNTSGLRNVALGSSTLESNDIGSNNIAIGWNAGNSVTGSNNVMLGHEAGRNNTGQSNVMIGHNAGKNAIGSNKLYIENSDAGSSEALIYGDFNNDFLSIHGQFTVRHPSSSYSGDLLSVEIFDGSDRFRVDTDGDAFLAGTLTQNSDKRLKKNIIPLNESLSKILELNGYNYLWKDENRSSKLQTGVIAQELIEVFPELVDQNEEYYSVNYIGLIPHIIESTKEQQSIISAQQQQIESQESRLQEQQKMIDQLVQDMVLLRKKLEK